MRRVVLSSVVVVFAMLPHLAGAGPKVIQVDPSNSSDEPQTATGALQDYRGYRFDLSENAGRKDVEAITDMLKRQLDIVESAGLSPRVLQFLRTVPIVASEMACLDEGAGAACYGAVAPNRGPRVRALTSWDSGKAQWSNPDPIDLAVDSGLGVIMLRPNMMTYAKDPVMLHEFLQGCREANRRCGGTTPQIVLIIAHHPDSIPRLTFRSRIDCGPCEPHFICL